MSATTKKNLPSFEEHQLYMKGWRRGAIVGEIPERHKHNLTYRRGYEDGEYAHRLAFRRNSTGYRGNKVD